MAVVILRGHLNVYIKYKRARNTKNMIIGMLWHYNENIIEIQRMQIPLKLKEGIL